MARSAAQLELTLAIPFDETLGYTCPCCLSVGIGKKWGQGTNYCPKCGQHIKLMKVEKDWAELKKDVMKIPDVMQTNIVTTAWDFSKGLDKDAKYINGVYLERFRDYKNKNAQIEGQMSIFDVISGT